MSEKTPDRPGATFINGKLAERPGEGTQPEEAQPEAAQKILIHRS